jgi:WD domain, G-beta repeat
VIRLWDRTTGQAVGTLGKHHLPAVGGGFHYTAFSPDGRLLAAATDDHAVHLWDLRTRKECRRLGGCPSDLRAIVFSPDGQRLAGGTQAKPAAIYLWDVTTGRQLRRISTPDEADPLVFAPDGKTIAAAGAYFKPVRLWDVSSGRQLRGLTDDRIETTALVFSPDGRFLAAAGATDTGSMACVWELSTGRRVRHLVAGTGVVLSLAFSPSSLTLATGSADSTILLWDITGRQDHGRLRAEHPIGPDLDAL